MPVNTQMIGSGFFAEDGSIQPGIPRLGRRTRRTSFAGSGALTPPRAQAMHSAEPQPAPGWAFCTIS
jgi:hypothetical protein